jgi:tetratricopeptide (TPR) repeat protein
VSQDKPGAPPPQGELPPDLAQFDVEEKDYVFRAQMALANFALGHWKKMLGVLGAVLLGVLLFGMWEDHLVAVQQEQYGAVAAAARKLPDPSSSYPFGPMDDPKDLDHMAALEGAANMLQAAAQDSTGSAAVYGYIQAAQAFERAGKVEVALECWQKAVQDPAAQGMMGWVAAQGAAAQLVAKKDVDGAAALLKARTAGEDIIAEEASYALGQLYLEAGRKEEAAAAFEDFRKRFSASERLPEVEAALARIRSQG